jgi:hypothetical protein
MGINTFDEFKNLELEERRTVLQEELKDQSIKKLSEKWGCKEGNLYDMRRNLGIPTTKGTLLPPAKYTPKKNTGAATGTAPKTQEKEITRIMPNNILESDSFTVRLVCRTLGEEISDRLMRIIEILNKDSNYQLTFDIKEIKPEPKPVNTADQEAAAASEG